MWSFFRRSFQFPRTTTKHSKNWLTPQASHTGGCSRSGWASNLVGVKGRHVWTSINPFHSKNSFRLGRRRTSTRKTILRSCWITSSGTSLSCVDFRQSNCCRSCSSISLPIQTRSLCLISKILSRHRDKTCSRERNEISRSRDRRRKSSSTRSTCYVPSWR